MAAVSTVVTSWPTGINSFSDRVENRKDPTHAAATMGDLQTRRTPRAARQDPDGDDHRQPVDPRLPRHPAPGLLPRPRAVVRIEPEDHAGVPRHHFRPVVVDG